jgi:hypothetical protein
LRAVRIVYEIIIDAVSLGAQGVIILCWIALWVGPLVLSLKGVERIARRVCYAKKNPSSSRTWWPQRV